MNWRTATGEPPFCRRRSDTLHPHHAEFIQALISRHKLDVVFYSKRDAVELSAVCAPLDYGPSRHAHDKTPRYHFWDYTSDEEAHQLSLPSEQILAIAPTYEPFDPGEFIYWPTNWHCPRDWGAFS
jgi:hypothetical protein